MFQQGRLEDAHRRCTTLIKTQRQNVDAHYLMGLIFERSQNYAEAVECFQQVLEIDPKHLGSLVNMGGLLTTLGRAKEAIDPLRKALKIDRDIFPARYNLARALKMTGDLDQAAREANRALSLNPEAAEVQFLVGDIYSAAGEEHKAIEGFRKCLEKLPDHVLAHVGLAVCLHRAGEFEEAKNHTDRALQISPDDPRLHLVLFGGTRTDEEDAKSLEVFQNTLNNENLPDNLKIDMEFASAVILDRQKKYDEAFTHLKRANDFRYEQFPNRRESIQRL
ncbi:MAG: tetratricopeptide repeat protein [Hyphomicrobiales bacterium]